MKTLAYIPQTLIGTPSGEAHLAAIQTPIGPEKPIVVLLSGWLLYPVTYQHESQSEIGKDSVLGPAWARVGSAIRELLNGSVGRLDCGTIDKILTSHIIAHGLDPD